MERPALPRSWTPAGLELEPGDSIEARVQEQARLAIAEADVIVFVVDASTGITPADLEAAELLRTRDGAGPRRGQQGRQRAARARGGRVLRARLGGDLPDQRGPRPGRRRPARRDRLGAPAGVRGRARPQGPRGRGRGLGARRRGRLPRAARRRRRADSARTRPTEADAAGDAIDAEARKWDAAIAAEAAEAPVAIAIVGRPNVGKSSLLNALLGEERMIVSDIPGTTRDAIDTTLAYGRSEIVLIDTAGLRRRGKVAVGPGGRALLGAARAAGDRPGRRGDPGPRRRRRPDRPGRPRGGRRRRRGQGARRRDQQVGPAGREDGPDVRRVRPRHPPPGAVPRLRPGRSRSAPRPASASGACSRRPSTCGASGASGSRPASSTGSSARPSAARSRRS